MKNQELVPKNNKKIKKVLILFTFTFVFAACLGFAQVISYLIIPTSTQVSQGLSTPSFKLYFISLTKSQLENSAHSLACDYQKLGAGGYVWKYNGYYHVIASCYEKENDATLVQNNIKVNYNLDSDIFSIDFTTLSLSGDYDNDGKKVLTKALKSFYVAYQELFDIAISLDTSVYNDISARLAINNVYSTMNSTLADFNTLYKNVQEQTLSLLGRHLGKAVNILENLCSGKLESNTQTYSSLIKYRYTQLLSTYYDFLNSF